MGKKFMRALTGTSTSPNKVNLVSQISFNSQLSILQDGAILAICILTLVTAAILLIDFIIMARFPHHHHSGKVAYIYFDLYH